MTVSYEAAATAPVRSSAQVPAKPGLRPGQLLKIGVTLGLSAYVLWKVGLGDSIATLGTATWGWVALAACSALFAMVLNVRRWQMMLAGQGGAAPMPTLIRLYLVAMFFNNVLPSRFGGDVVRAYGASIRLTTKTRSAAAVIMDRLIGAISVLLLGVIAVTLNPTVVPLQLGELLVAGLVVGVAVVGLLLARSPRLGSAWGLLAHVERVPLVGRKIRPRVEAAGEAIRSYAHRRPLIAGALAVSMVANGLSIVNIYLYSLAVGADITLAQAAVVTPVVLAVALLPISLNGLGTTELTFVLLFGAMGVPAEVALAIGILRRLVLLGQSLIGGVLYSARRFG
ncbi:MAG: flippase-like domain-containing protein [Chloroflexota bacterium]|nr:flippase-like domain-containing protein [Chloroflexota bacterium]